MKHFLTCAAVCALTVFAVSDSVEAGKRYRSTCHGGVTRSYHFTSADVVGNYHGSGCGVSGCATSGCATTGCSTGGCATSAVHHVSHSGCGASGCSTGGCGVTDTGCHSYNDGCHSGHVSHKCHHKVKYRKVRYHHSNCNSGCNSHHGCG